MTMRAIERHQIKRMGTNMKQFTFLPLLLVTAFASGAEESEIPMIKPLQVATDINSVDLLSGKYRPRLPVLSIPAAPNLTLHTLQEFNSKVEGVRPNPNPSNDMAFNEWQESYSVTFGAQISESFTCNINGCEPSGSWGSTFIGTIHSPIKHYRQGSTGIYIKYDLQSSFWDYSNENYPKDLYKGTWYASSISYPDGEKIEIDYDTASQTIDGTEITYYRPTTLTTNLGYELHIEYDLDAVLGEQGWNRPVYAKIVSSANPLEILAEHHYLGGSITDISGRQWQYTGFSNALGNKDTTLSYSMTLPGDDSPNIVIDTAERDYGGVPGYYFVTDVTNNGKQYQYEYTSTTDTTYEKHQQFSKLVITGPEGYRRELDYKVQGAPTFSQVIERDTDSLGHTTSYEYGYGNKVTKITYPEGNSVGVEYDAYSNITVLTKRPKPGSKSIPRQA